MTRTEVAFVVAGFALGGLGLFWIIDRSNSNAVRNCEEKCRVEGKKAIQPPLGTAGASIEGGGNRTDTSLDCQCIAIDSR